MTLLPANALPQGPYAVLFCPGARDIPTPGPVELIDDGPWSLSVVRPDGSHDMTPRLGAPTTLADTMARIGRQGITPAIVVGDREEIAALNARFGHTVSIRSAS